MGMPVAKPMSVVPTITRTSPSFEATTEAKKFFVDLPDDEGKAMVRFIRSVVVVTTSYGDKVAFMKSNRGQTYFDSRTPKKRISATECKAELVRLLDSQYEGNSAFRVLSV